MDSGSVISRPSGEGNRSTETPTHGKVGSDKTVTQDGAQAKRLPASPALCKLSILHKEHLRRIVSSACRREDLPEWWDGVLEMVLEEFGKFVAEEWQTWAKGRRKLDNRESKGRNIDRVGALEETETRFGRESGSSGSRWPFTDPTFAQNQVEG